MSEWQVTSGANFTLHIHQEPEAAAAIRQHSHDGSDYSVVSLRTGRIDLDIFCDNPAWMLQALEQAAAELRKEIAGAYAQRMNAHSNTEEAGA